MKPAAPMRMACQPLCHMSALASPAAANTASATGGVIADSTAKYSANMCAAGVATPSLMIAGTSSDTITM